jgi:hypothetical protein
VPTGVSVTALAEGFRWVFIAAAIGLGAGLASLLAMQERPLRGSLPKPQEHD